MTFPRSIICFLALLATCLVPAQGPAQDLPTHQLVKAVPAVRTANLVGFTRARRTIGVVSEEDGRVVSVAADVGEAIGKNGVFATLDTTFIDLDLAANRTEQKRLKSEIAFLGKETKRRKDLRKQESIAQSTLDDYLQQLAQARLRLAALQVSEKNLQERRKRHRVPAMPGALVIQRNVEPGEWITRGSTLGTVGDYSTLLVPFALTAEEHLALQAMRSLCVVLPESQDESALPLPEVEGGPLGGACVPARIERVSPEFDPETRKINVDLAVDQGVTVRRGGLRVLLYLELPDPSGTVLVPQAAVQSRYEEHFVQLADGTPLRVQYLGKDGELAKVRSPELEAGDMIRAQAEIGEVR